MSCKAQGGKRKALSCPAAAESVHGDSGDLKLKTPPSALLPVGTELYIKLPSDYVLAGNAGSSNNHHKHDKPREACEEDEGGNDVNYSTSTSWVLASVVRSRVSCRQKHAEGSILAKKRKVTEEEVGAHPTPWYLLNLDAREKHHNEKNQWLELHRWPFWVCRMAEREDSTVDCRGAEDEDPERILLAAHTLAPLPCVELTLQTSRLAKVSLGARNDQRAWLADILRASSAEDIAALVAECGCQFDKVNLACAMHRMGRVASAGTIKRKSVRTAVQACVDRILGEKLEGYSAQAAANICWALAKLGFQAPSTSEAKAEDTTNLSLTVSVATVFKLVARKTLEEIQWSACTDWGEVSSWTDNWRNSGLWGGWKPQELANLCWAFSRFAGKHIDELERRLFCTVAQGASISRWYGFSPQEMSNVVAALSAANLVPERFLRLPLTKMVKHVDMFKPQELCQILLPAARCGMPIQKLRPALCKALTAAVEADLKNFNSIDLTNLMWVVGVAQGHTKISESAATDEVQADLDFEKVWTPFVEKVIAKAKDALARWRPVEIGALVNSLARIRRTNSELLQEVCTHWLTMLSKDSLNEDTQTAEPGATQPQALSSIALALAKLGHVDVALMKQICMRARAAIRKGVQGWGAQEATNVLWATTCSLALVSSDSDGEISEKDADSLCMAINKLLRTLWTAVKKERLELGGCGEFSGTLYIAYIAIHAHHKRRGASNQDSSTTVEPPSHILDTWRDAYQWQWHHKRSKEQWLEARSPFHKSVSDTLETGDFADMFPQGFKVKNEVDVGGLQVDIMVKPRGTDMRIAIEVDGKTHFVTPLCIKEGSPTLFHDGRSRLKHWLLRHFADLRVISVSKHEWTANKKNERTLLRRLLQEAMA